MSVRILHGDCREVLKTLPDGSVHCVVTSPPYFALRDYGVAGQIGLEATPADFVAVMVDVFREVRRVLRSDGTLWLNLGDSYAHGGCGERDPERWPKQSRNDHLPRHAKKNAGFKPKDMMGIPWRVAIALQDDGWWLRSDIIWEKPNPMPEAVTDRPTKAHEYVFLLTKSAQYFYDAEAIKEPVTGGAHSRGSGVNPKAGKNEQSGDRRRDGFNERWRVKQNASFSAAVSGLVEMRNSRTVWKIASEPFAGAHFATFPPELPERCISAGCPVGGTVLDPFGGAGTTGLVADRLGRDAILIELNPAYAEMAEQRLRGDAPLLAEVART